ncbi:MAG: signal peptidase I [Lachnospiraceae bacterium]|nr:signal peptidase I [Lachnospiraceae bacterium]
MAKKGRQKKKKSVSAGILEFGLFVLAVLILALLMSKFGVERVKVRNHSMEHTLEPDDGVMIDKISYRFHDPERFDIIVFRQKGTGEELIKRVIGLPHETVQIVDGRFLINGEEIEDVKGLDAPEYAGLAASPIELSVGEYFVVGDNRTESIDSRYDEVGIVTSTRITGRMFMRLLPLNRIKFF